MRQDQLLAYGQARKPAMSGVRTPVDTNEGPVPCSGQPDGAPSRRGFSVMIVPRLSGVTPGELDRHLFHRASPNALPRMTAHAGPDALGLRSGQAMFTRLTAARALAHALLAGPVEASSMTDRAKSAWAKPGRWLAPLAGRIEAHFGLGTRPTRARIEAFLLKDPGFQRACRRRPLPLELVLPLAPRMCPAAGPPTTWPVPAIVSVAELGEKLNLAPNYLSWFADCEHRERFLPQGPLRHYWYRWQPKRDGSARLIESPKQRLKTIQRWILRAILDQMPSHEAAHGFRPGRSAMSFAQPHVGKRMVLRLDLKDFFPSVVGARVMAVFLAAGYPEPVAKLLANLCTNTTPREVFKSLPGPLKPAQARSLRWLYERAHLPQGAPSSPTLANLCAFRLDCRLAGLARAAGATYTRYADDLVFSGDERFALSVNRFYIHACAIALEEGFEVRTRKTRIMRRSVSQRAAGLVLNERLNIPRKEFDRLKAILHNCISSGPDSQNREGIADFRAHLAGRISYVEQVAPAKGRRLRAQFDHIGWPATSGGAPGQSS